jgi:hypothetical protein
MLKAAAAVIYTIGMGAALQFADVTVFPGVGPISPAQAVVGRPLTPGSVAGVSRRVTRRHIRRTGYTIAHLPAGCAYGSYYGYSAYHCGGHYYQKSGNVYVQVTFY